MTDRLGCTGLWPDKLIIGNAVHVTMDMYEVLGCTGLWPDKLLIGNAL